MSDGGRAGMSGGAVISSSQHRRNTRILSSRFNQEQNCIAVATTQGFRVLNCDPFSKCYEFSQLDRVCDWMRLHSAAARRGRRFAVGAHSLARAVVASCVGADEGGVSLVEMLYCTSLIALVGAGEQPAFSPRRLRIFNTKTEKVRVAAFSTDCMKERSTQRKARLCGS